MDILSATVMLTLIMDPFGNMPVFHAVLKGVAPQRRRVIIAREAVIALGILLAFLWAGRPIMSFLNLRPPTLNISGGIILFVIALRMVFPRQETEPAGLDEEPLIVPLAVPLIAGPAAIALLMLLANTAPQRMSDWTLALLLSWAFTAGILVCSPWIMKRLTNRGVKAVERLTGMLLIMVGVQMLLDGIANYLGL